MATNEHEEALRETRWALGRAVLEKGRDKIEQAREESDDIIRTAVSTFHDYYEKDLKPNISLRLVKRQKEYTGSKYQLRDRAYYTYLMSLVATPPVRQGFPYKPYEDWPITTGDQISGDDWHPDVALQFDVSLFEFMEDEETLGSIKPVILIGVWGDVTQEAQALVSRGTTFSRRVWNNKYEYALFEGRDSTLAQITPERFDPPALRSEISSVLRIATPNVLGHRSFWMPKD